MKVLILPLLIFLSSGFSRSTDNSITHNLPKKEIDIIDKAKWLVGSWKGDGFGGTSEETWSVPADGTMMGMFRHLNAEGDLVFYEFLLLDNTGLRLKHFHPDLKSWEEKDDTVFFEMIRVTPTKIELKGLSFELLSENTMKIKVDLKSSDGEIHTEVFSMERVK